MKKSYGERMKDPRWQKKRLEVLSRDGWKCVYCGDGTKTLHVHHTYYVAGRDPWEYPSGGLVSLCEDCHEHEPEYGATIFDWLAASNQVGMSRVESLQPGQAEAARLISYALCAWADIAETGALTSFCLDEIEKAAASLHKLAAKNAEAEAG